MCLFFSSLENVFSSNCSLLPAIVSTFLADNNCVFDFFRKRGTRLKITISSSKFKKVLDNKAEKCRNILKNLSKTKLISSKKVKKVDDNRSRFERKIDFGGGAFFRICGGRGWHFFESSNF